MKLQKDLKEFIELLNSQGVEYLVVGGHAVGFHGYPRYTGDIDLLLKPSVRNAGRVVKVLEHFGFPEADQISTVLSQPGKLLQLGVVPNRIDLLTSVSGVDFEEFWQEAESGNLGGVPVRFPSLESLLRNKRASGRPKDLADVDELEKVHGSRTES